MTETAQGGVTPEDLATIRRRAASAGKAARENRAYADRNPHLRRAEETAAFFEHEAAMWGRVLAALDPAPQPEADGATTAPALMARLASWLRETHPDVYDEAKAALIRSTEYANLSKEQDRG